VPGALLGVVGRALAPTRLVDFSSEQVRFLTYGRAIDTGRARRELGFSAKRSTSTAFEEFLAGHDLGPGLVDGVLDRVGSLVTASGGSRA
jgi:UDP-glucose 4-epimerase